MSKMIEGGEQRSQLADFLFKQAGERALLTVQDVAPLLNKKPGTLENYLSRGKIRIPFIKMGGRMMITVTALAGYLESIQSQY